MTETDGGPASRRRVLAALATAGSALAAGCATDDEAPSSRTAFGIGTGASSDANAGTSDGATTERDAETTDEYYKRLTMSLESVERSRVAAGVLTDPESWDVYERELFQEVLASGRATFDAIALEPLRERAYVAVNGEYVRVDRSVEAEREVRAYDFGLDAASPCDGGGATTTSEPVPVSDLPPADRRTVRRGYREYYADGTCFSSSGPIRYYDDAAAERSILLDSPSTTVLVDGETYVFEYEGRRDTPLTTYAFEPTTLGATEREYAAAVAPDVVWHVDPDAVDDALVDFFETLRAEGRYEATDPIPDVATRFAHAAHDGAYDARDGGVHYLEHDGAYFEFSHLVVQT